MREALGRAIIDSRSASRSRRARARAGDPGFAGHGARPRVRPHRAGARLRAARRRADPRPADPQGRAPPRRPAGDRHRSAERPGRQRGSDRATPPATRPHSSPRWMPRSPATQRRRDPEPADMAAFADYLRDGGEDIVILWGERLLDPAAPPRCWASPTALGLADHDGAGLLEIPRRQRPRPARGGRAPERRPGYSELDGRRPPGAPPANRPGGRRRRDHRPYLLQTDPLRDLPDARWERALHRAGVVVAHAAVLTEGIPSTPTWSSRPSPTPRRRARSSTPTAACNACARRSRTPARCAGLVGDCRARQARRPRHRRAHQPDGLRPARRGGALLRRADARGDRRPRDALASRDAACRSATPAARPASRSCPAGPSRLANGALCQRPLRLGPTARSGRRPGRDLPALQFTIAASRSSSLPRTPSVSGIANGDTVEWRRTGRGCRVGPRTSRRAGGGGVPGRGHRGAAPPTP